MILHVFDVYILKYLTKVNIPHGLVVPDLGSEYDGA